MWKPIFNKHKSECKKQVLAFAETKEDADEIEKEYIELARLKYGDKCVNLADGGVNYVHKVGEFKHSPEARAKMSAARKGKPKSEEWKRKMSEAMTGVKHSEEQRRKNSESHKGQIPWNKGLTGIYSEETRKKMSDSAKRRKISEETIEKRRMTRAKRKQNQGQSEQKL